MANIAVLGTGHMGAAIALRLLATGHQVSVWNRQPERAAALGNGGAVVAATPVQAVDGADVVMTVLTDASAVDAVLFGPVDVAARGVDGGGASVAIRPGAVLVQMSTIGPDEVRATEARLPAGVLFLDAPVGGSVGAAGSGTLTIFAGGSKNVLELAQPVLGDLGTVRVCGGVGAGAAVKLVANAALVTALASLRDTLAVAAAVNVDPDAALSVLSTGPLGGAVRRATATGASFAIGLAAKDARLALRELPTAPMPAAPMLAAALDLLIGADDSTADIASIVAARQGNVLDARSA